MIGQRDAGSTPGRLHPAAGWVRGWVGDVAAAAVFTGFFLLAAGHNGPPPGGRAVDAFGYTLLAAAGVIVGLCRRFPWIAVVAVTLVLGCYLARSYPNGPIYLAGMLTLFSVGWQASRRAALAGAAAMVAALTVVAAGRNAALTVLPLIFVGWAGAAVLLGDSAGNRRARLDVVRERARSFELTRVEQARRRVAEDRLRIARDLHDSVGHAMAMINVQAGAGAHVADVRPEAAKAALVAIQRASGDVLDELTAMLQVLRADGESAERTPAPGIEQIRQLVVASASTRLRTSIVIEGPAGAVPEAVGVAAYRIVQESLTNVIRHSGATQVHVQVLAGAGRDLQVQVCDNGTGAAAVPSSGSGVGIHGMRERAESSGGRLEVAAGPHGGFVVRAAWGPRP
jgi:signal transduction histidine kinase